MREKVLPYYFLKIRAYFSTHKQNIMIIVRSVMQTERYPFVKGSKTGSYLTIEPKQGCTVPVAVWSVSERDELALDRYEGYPHFYYKTELELPLAETGKKLTAFVYIMHEERKLGIPTSAYIRTCVDGYHQFGFDLKHLRKAMDISEREVYHHENG